ncbi:MAG: zf-HC2 domain-containing protein [Actinophytocola sp.]|nr:zf-HC2 domain-containing protein [Actinophytocola sp.]
MISCAEAVRQLWEYLDDVIPETERVSVEAHLARCRRCCGELEFARELRLTLASTANESIPHGVLRRLHETLEELEP